MESDTGKPIYYNHYNPTQYIHLNQFDLQSGLRYPYTNISYSTFYALALISCASYLLYGYPKREYQYQPYKSCRIVDPLYQIHKSLLDTDELHTLQLYFQSLIFFNPTFISFFFYHIFISIHRRGVVVGGIMHFFFNIT